MKKTLRQIMRHLKEEGFVINIGDSTADEGYFFHAFRGSFSEDNGFIFEANGRHMVRFWAMKEIPRPPLLGLYKRLNKFNLVSEPVQAHVNDTTSEELKVYFVADFTGSYTEAAFHEFLWRYLDNIEKFDRIEGDEESFPWFVSNRLTQRWERN